MSNALMEYDSQRTEHLSIATMAHKIAGDIQTDQQYIEASEFLMKIKERRRQWEKLIDPAIESAHQSHKRILNVKKEVDQPLKRAEDEILKPALLAYSQKKERERKEAEDRLNRLLQEEAAKKRAEEQAKLDAERKAAEEERAKNALLDASGNVIAPSEPLPPPVELPPPPPPPVVVLPKMEEPKGLSFAKTYVAEVTDMSALLQAIVAGLVPIEAVKPNDSFINQRAKTLKELMKWPGVTVKEETSVRATSQRSFM